MDNINNLKVLQLKELCREMQISTSGTKNELKLRIKKHLKIKNEMNSKYFTVGAEPKSPNPSPTILQISSNDKNSEKISIISDRKTQKAISRILITKTNNNNLKRKRESIEINQNRKDEVDEITYNNSEEESLDDNTHIEMRELAHYDSINQNSEMEEPKAKKQRGNGLIYLPMMDENNEIIDYKEYSVAEDLILKENNWLKGN